MSIFVSTALFHAGDGDAIAAPRHPTLLNTNIYPAVNPAPHHSTSTEPELSFKFG